MPTVVTATAPAPHPRNDRRLPARTVGSVSASRSGDRRCPAEQEEQRRNLQATDANRRRLHQSIRRRRAVGDAGRATGEWEAGEAHRTDPRPSDRAARPRTPPITSDTTMMPTTTAGLVVRTEERHGELLQRRREAVDELGADGVDQRRTRRQHAHDVGDSQTRPPGPPAPLRPLLEPVEIVSRTGEEPRRRLDGRH